MLIPRFIEKQLSSQLGKQKVLLLYGTRRTGKTTILGNIESQNRDQVLTLQGEDLQVADLLKNRTVANYSRLFKGRSIVIIDEAQAVPEIGKVLKLIIDNVKGVTVLASGSSSFDLAYHTGEPLVGRNKIYELYPIAQAELSEIEDRLTTAQNLEHRLIYGSYPELWHLDSDLEQQAYLKQMVNSYLLKDLLTFENVKGADKLFKLLQLLAFQVGSQVSTVELSNNLGINKATVERYLDLLAKVFIIYPLSGYSSNLRKEVSKSKKWFFYDNGIRNAVISNFSGLTNRNDIGHLWEQYILSERIKFNSSRGAQRQYFFWRTYDGQEIDLVELDNNQEMQGFECKWSAEHSRTPVAFSKAYPQATYAVVHKYNYLDFITQA